MTDDERRAYATDVLAAHRPAQADIGVMWSHCATCLADHPCQPHTLAGIVLDLLDRDG